MNRLLALCTVMIIVLSAVGCGGGGGGSTSGPGTLTLSDAPISSTGGTGTSSLPVNTSPRNAPTLPFAAPPAVGKSMPAAVAPRTGAPRATVTYSLPAGWSAISFPFETVTSTTGFTYQLYKFDPLLGWTTVDPSTPANIDTTLGYLAFTDAGTTVSATGTSNAGNIARKTLVAGWNLIGCPLDSALVWKNVSFTRVNATRAIEDAAKDGLDAGDMWLYRYALRLSSGSFSVEDLAGAGATLPTTQARFVWAWQDMELNLNPVPPSPLPNVTGLSTSSLVAGNSLTITGTGLGSVDQGMVVIGGMPVPVTSITSWTATQIQLTVPATVVSGLLVVFNNRYPSNRTQVTVTGGGGGGSTGSVSAAIRDATTGAPLSGAQFMLDNGQCGTSATDGTLTIANVPSGQHIGYVTLIGYQTAIGQVTVQTGSTTQVNVGLAAVTSGGGGSGSGGSGSGGTVAGTLVVQANQYSSGGTWWPSQISVHEYGNYTNRWSNNWYYSANYESLTCSGAVVGRTYAITITWQNDQGQTTYNTWYRTLYNTYQTETFYSVNG